MVIRPASVDIFVVRSLAQSSMLNIQVITISAYHDLSELCSTNTPRVLRAPAGGTIPRDFSIDAASPYDTQAWTHSIWSR